MMPQSNDQEYLCFRVGQEWYGINIDHIIEVIHLVALTDLPGTTPAVLGLMTIRDMVMPVIDLRVLFQLPEATLRLNTPLIAFNTPHGPMGVAVDDVDDVKCVTGRIDSQSHASPFVTGVVKMEERLLLLLDIERIHADVRVQMPEPEA